MDYHIRHAIKHFIAYEAWDELEEVLTKLEFLEAMAETGLVFELAADLARGVKSLPKDRSRWWIVELLDEALRRDIHFIARHPTTLFQCLWSTCWWYDCPEAAEYYAPPEGGWPSEGLPWQKAGPRLAEMLEAWRRAREQRTPGRLWIRSMRPPALPLGSPQRLVLSGHNEAVDSVAFSPDGMCVASGSADKTVRIWNIETGQELACFRGHQFSVCSVAFCAGGTQIASGANDGGVRIWDISTRQEIASLAEDDDETFWLALSSDGKLVARGSIDAKAIRVLDIISGRELACLEPNEGRITSIAFPPQPTQVACGTDDSRVRIWDIEGREETACCRSEGSLSMWAIRSLAYSPDGRLIAAAEGTVVRVWDLSSGRERLCLNGHDENVFSVAFCADGRRIASGGQDCTVRIWSLDDGRELACFRGHGATVHGVAFSPDGNLVVSGSVDATVRLWDISRSQTSVQLPEHQSWVRGVRLSPDGKHIAGYKGGDIVRETVPPTAYVWDLATGQEVVRLSGHEDAITSLAFSPKGTHLATGSSDKTVRLWDLSTGREISCMRRHKDAVLCVTFSPDGQQIASGGADRKVRLWDKSSGRQIACLRGHKDVVSCVAYSPDGKYIATGSYDCAVRLWHSAGGGITDWLRGRKSTRLVGHDEMVHSVAFSRDGTRIAASAMSIHLGHSRDCDYVLRVWEVASGECCEATEGPGVISYNGDISGIAGGEHRVLWRLPDELHETSVESVRDGQRIAWLPVQLGQIAPHPAGRIWVGVSSMALDLVDHLYVFSLEGSTQDEPLLGT